jgi:hypothetical protein
MRLQHLREETLQVLKGFPREWAVYLRLTGWQESRYPGNWQPPHHLWRGIHHPLEEAVKIQIGYDREMILAITKRLSAVDDGAPCASGEATPS